MLSCLSNNLVVFLLYLRSTLYLSMGSRIYVKELEMLSIDLVSKPNT